MNIEFSECILKIDGNPIVFEHPIISARTDGELIYLIFDYIDFPKDMQANNLECIDSNGNFKWCAESPLNSPSSAFSNFIEFESKLVVGNFAGFNATINKATGIIESTEFTK